MIINYITGKTETDLYNQFCEDVEFCKTEENLNVIIFTISNKKITRADKLFPSFQLDTFESTFDMLAFFGNYINNSNVVECVFIRDSHLLNCNQVNAIEVASKMFSFNVNFYGLESMYTPVKNKIMKISKNVFMAPFDSFIKHYYEEDKIFAQTPVVYT